MRDVRAAHWAPRRRARALRLFTLPPDASRGLRRVRMADSSWPLQCAVGGTLEDRLGGVRAEGCGTRDRGGRSACASAPAVLEYHGARTKSTGCGGCGSEASCPRTRREGEGEGGGFVQHRRPGHSRRASKRSVFDAPITVACVRPRVRLTLGGTRWVARRAGRSGRGSGGVAGQLSAKGSCLTDPRPAAAQKAGRHRPDRRFGWSFYSSLLSALLIPLVPPPPVAHHARFARLLRPRGRARRGPGALAHG